MTEQEILNWMQTQYDKNGVVLFTTRDIADGVCIKVCQALECLENLASAGIIDRTSAGRSLSVLWFLL